MFLALFGCTQTDLVIPTTWSQLLPKVYETDGLTLATNAKYYAGDYNGLCFPQIFDENKLKFYDCNSGGGSGDVNWSDISGLPIGCPAGYAIQVLNDDLTCIAIGAGGSDTNVWTEGFMDVNNIWVHDFNVAGHVVPASTLSYDLGSVVKRWLNLFVSNINADEVEVSGDVNVLGAVEANSFLEMEVI